MKAKASVYYFVMGILCILITVISMETMVRMLVPREVFWPIDNIYSASKNPSVGYTFRPNYEGTAFGVSLRTNGMGFRGPDWAPAKPPGTFRIFLIGDSHAFAYGVPFESSVGERLAFLLNRNGRHGYEVLNFGVNGYNSHQQLAVLKHYAPQFQPDAIIVIPTNNDHEIPLVVGDDGWLHWGGTASVDTRIYDDSIRKIKTGRVSWFDRNSRFALYVRILAKKYQIARDANRKRPLKSAPAPEDWLAPFPAGPISPRLQETVYAPLKEMTSLARKLNIPIVFAHFSAALDYRQLFEVIGREDDGPTLALLELFPEARSWQELQEQFSLGWNDHLNAIAHERWAEALADLMREREYLPE